MGLWEKRGLSIVADQVRVTDRFGQIDRKGWEGPFDQSKY